MNKPFSAKLMLSNLILLTLILISNKSTAQEFEWVKLTATGNISTYAIDTDNEGNIYTTGRFVSTFDFDPGPEEFLLSAHGITGDVFIRKMDTDGNFIWAKSIIGYGADDQGHSLDVSPDGDEVYISGFFQDSADFDPGIGTFMIEAEGYIYDLFALKLDGDGNFQWAHNIPGAEFIQRGNAIRRDNEGNVVFTGNFNSVFDFDPDPGFFETFPLYPDGSIATFVQKLDADGDLIWANRISGANLVNASTDDDQNILLGGKFMGEVDFDGGPGEFLVDSEGSESAFVVQLDSDGNFNWVSPFIGSGLARVEFVEPDLEGNIVCSGMYTNTIDFDPSPSLYELTSNGSSDHFFLKLDGSGSLAWAKTLGCEDVDWSRGLVINTDNDILISGAFLHEEIDLDPGIDEELVANNGMTDFYIEKLDEDGNLIWWKRSNGEEVESITTMAIDTNDQLYLAGKFSDTIDFNFCPLAEYELVGIYPGASSYVLKLSYCDIYDDTITTEACESYTSSEGIVYTETGTYYEIFEGICNCDSVVTYNLTIATIESGITQDGTELTANEDDPDATYQWVDCETGYTIIPDETDQLFIAPESGEYAVIVYNGSCTDTSDCITINKLGLNSSSLEMDVLIFPNPTTGKFYIQLGETYQTVALVLRNVAGEVIQRATYESITTIPMEMEQAKGIYFLEIKTDTGAQSFFKIVYQ